MQASIEGQTQGENMTRHNLWPKESTELHVMCPVVMTVCLGHKAYTCQLPLLLQMSIPFLLLLLCATSRTGDAGLAGGGRSRHTDHQFC